MAETTGSHPQRKVYVGSDLFTDFCRDDVYYVDKTQLIEKLLAENFKAILFARPRRFGKSLNMSMLAEFFDIRKDSRALFAGLKISADKALCDRHMNRHPVIFMSLKQVEGLTFEDAYAGLVSLLSRLCRSYAELCSSERLAEEDRQFVSDLISVRTSGRISKADARDSLIRLSSILHAHYGVKPIIIIDEYDVPIAKADEHGYRAEMMDLMRGFLGGALKSNPDLEFAVLTGCLRISKESIFTGLNNFMVDTISDDGFSDCFGFTAEETAEMAGYFGLNAELPLMREWYDGYRFGSRDMYCPWDLVNYVSNALRSPGLKPKAYWKNSSGNAIVRSILERCGASVQPKFETLMSGGCICEKLDEELTYDSLHMDEKALWSMMYLTGYLTLARPDECDEPCIDDDRYLLRIPNKEVLKIYEDSVETWFNDRVVAPARTELFDALWSGDADKCTFLLSNILLETISYHDYSENYYHAFLAGIFSGAGHAVESNREHGLGRPDIVAMDIPHQRLIIIEVKHSASYDALEKDAGAAIRQIDVRKYVEGSKRGYRHVTAYGAAFFEKSCVFVKAD